MNSSLRKIHNDVNAYGTDKSIYYRRLSFAGILLRLMAYLPSIALEGKPSSLMSQEFLQKYHLGASTVQGAVKTLLDRDFITQDDGVFQLCDKFLELSLRG